MNESLKRIFNKIEFRPKCPTCGCPVNWIGKKEKLFTKYCSNKCSARNSNTKLLAKETYKKKTGYPHNSQNPESISKIKETCLKKYGATSVVESEYAKEQRKKSFGYNSYFQTEKFKRDAKSIYNTINKTKIQESNKQTWRCNRNEILAKAYETKKRNHTFNTSKPEEILYKKLVDKYGIDDVVRQYKSDVYPFACDFYIKSKDMYMEYQGSWTHGEHPYNPNSEKDQFILEQWKEKAKTSKYYKNAIETWVIRDIKKREIAKRNNLNFVEIWNLS